MPLHLRNFILLLFPLLTLACSPPPGGETTATIETTRTPESSSSAASQPLDTIRLPISVYIVDDEAEALSSARSAEELTGIYERVNQIWAQAGIEFDVQVIQRVVFPASVLHSLAGGDFDPFFNGVGRSFEVPNPSTINGFYVRDIGGPNGIAPFGARLFFVMDTPSVHDERVSAHEIGHILGLQHTLDDQGRLLYPGTNGMLLTEEEIIVARYNARVLLERGR